MHLNYLISDIAKCINAKIIGNDTSLVIKQVSFDSRSPLINKHTMFFALKGVKTHGQNYVGEFANHGGKVVVVEKEQEHGFWLKARGTVFVK